MKSCKFNKYKIINSTYEKYQKYISDLKNKLKIGVKDLRIIMVLLLKLIIIVYILEIRKHLI